VNVPSVPSSSDLALRFYYGGAAAVQQANPELVWNSNYAAVLHMGDGVTLSVADSSAHITPVNYGAVATAGKVGGAASFDGAEYILLGDCGISNSGFTIQMWHRADSDTAQYPAAFATVFDGGDNCYRCEQDGGAIYIFDGSHVVYFTNPLTKLAWTHRSLVVAVPNLSVYTDGALTNTITNANSRPVNRVAIGRGFGSRYDLADTDEFRVSNVARPAAWIAYDHTTQKNDAWATWGVEEMPHRFLAGSVGGAGNAVAAGTVIVPLAGAIGGQGNAAVSGSEVGAPPSGGASPVVIGSRVIPMPRHLWSP